MLMYRSRALYRYGSLFLLLLLLGQNRPALAQHTERKSFFYNSLIGGFSGSIGALINKRKGEKWYRVLAKGFVVGTGGGALLYTGKKMNHLVADKSTLGYAYLSRAVFSLGNSLVENAAANRKPWAMFHYDIGFIRVEFQTEHFSVRPRLMPLTFAGTVFLAVNGKFDLKTTLQSGTPTFRTGQIGYSPRFMASTPTNGFLFRDSLRSGAAFYEVYAHEMVHAFQFQEYSGCNYFARPLTARWALKSAFYRKWQQWVYGDLNYAIMGINYFVIQKGHRVRNYCDNFLENEAETLSTGRPACPEP